MSIFGRVIPVWPFRFFFQKVAAQSLPSLDLHYPLHAPRPEALPLRFLVLNRKAGQDGEPAADFFHFPKLTNEYPPTKRI